MSQDDRSRRPQPALSTCSRLTDCNSSFKVEHSRRYGNKEAAKLKLLSITGSIGMGKTATASMFRSVGVPVHDSDKAVHKLYAGDAVGPIGQLFPTAVREGRVDRKQLANILQSDKMALLRIEQIIHPLVAKVPLSKSSKNGKGCPVELKAVNAPVALFVNNILSTIKLVIFIKRLSSNTPETVLEFDR
jgi:dephospho-CoA kinase